MNIWSIACAGLLGIINWFTWSIGSIAVYSGSNPVPWNIFHYLANTSIAFLFGYGVGDVLLGCVFGIVISIGTLIYRYSSEYFEWE